MKRAQLLKVCRDINTNRLRRGLNTSGERHIRGHSISAAAGSLSLSGVIKLVILSTDILFFLVLASQASGKERCVSLLRGILSRRVDVRASQLSAPMAARFLYAKTVI